MNAEQFWAVRKEFMERYGVQYQGVDEPAPADPEAVQAQAKANLQTAMSVLERDADLVTWLSDRLVAIGDSVPDEVGDFRLGEHSAEVFGDRRIFDVTAYPDEHVEEAGREGAEPGRPGGVGRRTSTRSRCATTAGRCSSRPPPTWPSPPTSPGSPRTSTALPGTGWYERNENPTAPCCRPRSPSSPTPAWSCGLATVNLADDPFTQFDGFWGACSTYGSFSYLKYGEMRLFSQLAQDCELKVGKVLWIAGHSGPETAEDSRTHFGIFSIGVTQLFPDGHVIDLHPWEYNEVPVLLGAAFSHGRPDRRAAPDPPAGGDTRPRGARHPVPLRGGARRVRDAAVPARPAPRRDRVRARHHADPEPGQPAAGAGRPRHQREDRRRGEPAALRAPARGVPAFRGRPGAGDWTRW